MARRIKELCGGFCCNLVKDRARALTSQSGVRHEGGRSHLNLSKIQQTYVCNATTDVFNAGHCGVVSAVGTLFNSTSTRCRYFRE